MNSVVLVVASAAARAAVRPAARAAAGPAAGVTPSPPVVPVSVTAERGPRRPQWSSGSAPPAAFRTFFGGANGSLGSNALSEEPEPSLARRRA